MIHWRDEFEAALAVLARVSSALDSQGIRPPVLVGGAAVELYTLSAISTGDFDLVTSRQDQLEAALAEHGFVRPAGPGLATRGWVHPALGFGFEVVGSRLLDGLADSNLIRVIEIVGEGSIAVIAAEDLIADRMGQYASGSAAEMLDQALALYRLSTGLDLSYMDRRIREETAQAYGVQDLEDAD